MLYLRTMLLLSGSGRGRTLVLGKVIVDEQCIVDIVAGINQGLMRFWIGWMRIG